MAYAGHILGPRKSELIERHGSVYFGCDDADRDADILCHRQTEGLSFPGSSDEAWLREEITSGRAQVTRGNGGIIYTVGGKQVSVDPVDVDEQGRPYIAWGDGSPDKWEYLDRQLDPIFLEDPNKRLLTYTPDEADRFHARLAA